MPDNVVGSAWVAIRPDLSGFATSLTAGLTDAITKVQAVADARPIKLRVALDVSEAVAQLSALNLAAGGAGGGSGIIGGAVAGGAAGGGGNGGFAAGVAAQRLLGVGPGASRGIFGIGAGLAGGFSLLSFAGLGVEHVLTTIIGLVGSLAGAIGGGLLLALGAASVAIVGMGSDLLVMKSTIADTRTLGAALTAIQTAQLTYGKNSAQAAAATQALNVQMQLLGDTAGVKAELGLAKALQAVNAYWDKATSTARVAAVNFIEPFLTVAYTYIPLINQAATTNFGIMTQAFEPLIAFMNGPGTAIFMQLEAVFAKDLPYVIGAVTLGIELLLRSVDYMSSFVGGLSKSVDDFLTRANGPGWSNWVNTMTTLIGLFHTWYDFLKIIVIDVVDFFKLTAGLGSSIIQTLTGMLTQLHNWLNLTTTKTSLHNLFELHKQEVIDLLHLLPILLDSMANIYLTIAPLLTGALIKVLEAVTPILKAITSNAWGAWVIGMTLILTKLGLLITALGILKGLVTGSWLTGLGAAFNSVKTTLLGGAVNEAVSATGVGKGVQAVYVTNWAQVGGGGSGPTGLVAKAGIIPTIIGALGGTAAAITALGVAALLAGPVLAAFAFWKPPPTSGQQQGKTGIAGLFADLQNSQSGPPGSGGGHGGVGVQPLVVANLNAITSYLQSIGLPLSKAQHDANLIQVAFANGSVKTPAQLQSLITKLTGINTSAAGVSTGIVGIDAIVGKSVPQIAGGFSNIVTQLVNQGWSFKNANSWVGLLRNTIATYGPLTQVQVETVYQDWLHGQSAAWQIALSLETGASNLGSVPLNTQGIAEALALLHKSIPKSFNLPGGGVGFFGNLTAGGGFFDKATNITVGEAGPEVVLNRREFQAMMGGAQGSGRSVTVNNYTTYQVGSNAQRTEMEQVVQANNRRLLTTLRSL